MASAFLSDCVRFFPELKENAAWLRFNGNDCVEIDIERVLPGQTQTRCTPEAIFFLDRSRNRVSREAMDRTKRSNSWRRISCMTVLQSWNDIAGFGSIWCGRVATDCGTARTWMKLSAFWSAL